MKISTFASILAIVGIVYGFGLLVIPVKFMEVYGVTLNSTGSLIARLYGVTLGSLASIYWDNRNIPSTDKLWRGLLGAALFLNAAGASITAPAVLEGVTNSLGWTTVGLQVILAVISGYFFFKKR